MAEVKIDGFRELYAVFDNIPKSITRKASLAAGKKAAKPILDEARNNIETVKKETEGNLDGFQHLLALSKATKIETFKNTVFVRVSQKHPDLPMASSRKWWTIKPSSFLFAFGRQNEGKGSRGKKTGQTKGFGDWIEEAGREKFFIARQTHRRLMEKEIEKAINRTVRRYGKQK